MCLKSTAKRLELKRQYALIIEGNLQGIPVYGFNVVHANRHDFSLVNPASLTKSKGDIAFQH